MSNLLIDRGGRTVGPFTPDEVRRYLAKGHVAPQTLAWTDGLMDWAPLDEVLPRAESQTGDGPPEFTDTAGRNIVPDEVRGFSWGAFLCGPLWGFPYRLWVSIFSWVPGIGALMWLWLGFNGREIAWGAREWESPQAFLQSERRWAGFGWVVFVLVSIASVVFVLWMVQHRGGAGLPTQGTERTEQAPAPAEREAPERPTTRTKPAGAERGQPTSGGPVAPLARALWKPLLMGMEAKSARELLGAPASTQKLPDKPDVDVWIYRRLSYEDNPSDLDAFMLLGVQNGKVAGVEFVKKEGK